MNVQERFKKAKGLVESGEYPEATKELLWLWNHMLDEDKSFSGVRGSYLVAWMKRLAELHNDARVQFTALRDNLTPDIESEFPSYDNTSDWFTLSHNLLEDDKAIGQWIDKLLTYDKPPNVLNMMGQTIRSYLCESGRWADAGKILEPSSLIVARVRLDIEEEKHSDQYNDELRQSLAELRRRELVRAHASYFAANRDDEAWEIAGLLLEHFDKKQISVAIQEAAKKAGVESAKHEQLIRESMQDEDDD